MRNGATSRLHGGHRYTRGDLYDVLDVPVDQQRGDWETGYHQHAGEWFLFPTVGAPGRTGHDYGNRWIGDRLIWFGRRRSRLDHPSIQSLVGGSHPVHLFTRTQDREPFTYWGPALAESTEDSEPVRVVWRLVGRDLGQRSTGEIASGETAEGARLRIEVNRYERDPEARRVCIAYYGARCTVCRLSFGARYGELGEGYIQVHHLVPLASLPGPTEVDPIEDLRPVCANCHAMLHREDPPLGIDELTVLLRDI